MENKVKKKSQQTFQNTNWVNGGEYGAENCLWFISFGTKGCWASATGWNGYIFN